MPDLPIIIGGFYRSGTTLARRLLDSHSRIHCGPEVKFLKDFHGDYIDDPLSHARLFQTARSYGLLDEQLLRIFGSALVEFHEAAARAAGKARWADKNPENALYLNDWKVILPAGFLFLHVIRNPLDALASLIEARFSKAVPREFQAKVELYRKFREAGSAYVRANPESSFEIAYEDIVSAPDRSLRALMDWIGESFEPSALEGLNRPERGSGIEDPKAGRHASPHADSIGRGKRELSRKQRQIAERLLVGYL